MNGRPLLLKQKAVKPIELIPPSHTDMDIRAAIGVLVMKLYRRHRLKREQSRSRLWNYYQQARNKEILIVHSPGGYGNARWEGVQDWEKSIVTGVTLTVGNLGYNYVVVQYLRSGDGFMRHMKDMGKEIRFIVSGASYRADVMKEEMEFILGVLPKIKIVLVGASQGAAFNNAVMRRLSQKDRIYSIELGTFFPHMKRRRITSQNLAIDSNGLLPDPICQRDLWAGYKAYIRAFSRWVKYRLQGRKVKFTNCINTPGHEYKWEYDAVNVPITAFLTDRLGVKETK